MDSQVAVKAVIQNPAGQYLIMREGQRWQAVGGRLEQGERLAEGLRREVQEETGITDFTVGPVVHVDEWFASPEGQHKHIVAIFFRCHTTATTVTLSDEHEAFAWVAPEQLDSYGDTIEPEIKQAIQLADAH